MNIDHKLVVSYETGGLAIKTAGVVKQFNVAYLLTFHGVPL